MSRSMLAWTTVALVAALSGCRGQPSKEPPIVPIRNMHDQPRYDPQDRSEFFGDERTMRPNVAGTVSREMELDLEVESGRLADDSGWVLNIPTAVLERKGGADALLVRGRERYGIYCAPCHGLSGRGNGTVPTRAGVLQPPTYHDERLRHIPDGQMYATITNGLRTMPGYYAQIPTDDRWAIVAYVRALQISQASAPQEQNQ